MGELKDKYHWIKGSIINTMSNGGLSWYRVYRFFSSKTGRKRIARFGGRMLKYGFKKLTGQKNEVLPDYKLWLKKNELTNTRIEEYKNNLLSLKYQPLISIIIPVYNVPIQFLKVAIASVQNQIYTNWEICIADDCSTNPEVKTYLASLSEEKNIKVEFRKENGHISACSNSCLELAEGEFVALLDHDDLLTPDALYKNVLVLNESDDWDMIYSDEDKINDKGERLDPHFKPDWAPDSFLSRNYICHFTILRHSIIKEIGGFRLGYEGSQDYDLFLRFTEKTNRIYHIPEILYHWRIHEASAAGNENAKPYSFTTGKKAIEDALKRRNIKGNVTEQEGVFTIRYAIEKPGKVSIIIPSKDKADLCEVVLKSVFSLTNYPDFEVILISNNSSEASFFNLMEKWKKKEPTRFVFIEDNGNFNFARLMNNAAKVTSGEQLLLLNNDTEIVDADWLTKMVEQSQRNSIGAVGVKLLYPNNTVQHAGVVIGMGGIAGHTFVNFKPNEPGYFYFLNRTTNYSAVTAACLMVKKSAFDEVGGFDENLAIEFNDIDFCLKLKSKGYQNVYIPHVEVIHYESISRGHPHKTRNSFNQSMKETEYFRSKWQKYIDADPCYNPHLSLIFTDFRLNVRD